MRIVFMGTPEFAVPVLEALVSAGQQVVAAYSQPPRPGGRRGKAAVPSPVQMRAETLGIAVHTPVNFRDADVRAAFAAHSADVAVVAAYGLILPQAILDSPRHGCLNVHASLLPRWRGAAPIQRAILAGDTETGVGIMQMEAGLDTGPVRAEARTGVDGKTGGELTGELAALGAALMVGVLSDLDGYPPAAQAEDGITYAPKIDKTELRLDFAQSVEQVERQVRAFNPPGAWFEFEGERIRVLSCSREGGSLGLPALNTATLDPRLRGGTVLDDQLTIVCADGAIRATLVQRAGRGVMAATEFLRGFPILPGTRL